MKSIRSRLSYANVMATIAVVLALGGATAFAASHLARNSVGAEQLRKNAVTAAEIKDGAVASGKIADGAVSADKLANAAVTGGKIAGGAVSASKIANGSVTAEKLDPALALPQVVHRIVGTQSIPFPTTSTPVDYPLDNPAFIQPAGEDDLYIGAITGRFSANCKAPRSFDAALLIDAQNGLSATENVGEASVTDEGNGEVTRTAQFGAVLRSAASMAAPPSPTPHKFSIRLSRVGCASGSPAGSGATVTGAQIDVVGIR